jgi:protein-L-isoaspartate(D-aspartate) O-methyltransferase
MRGLPAYDIPFDAMCPGHGASGNRDASTSARVADPRGSRIVAGRGWGLIERDCRRPGERQRGARRRMVERIRTQGLQDERVLAALGDVPRDAFVPEALAHRAYDEDAALPIGSGQTISAPGIVAAMTAMLGLEGGETVLEVGTGSGYQAALLSRLAARVVSIERLPVLANRARSILDRLGVTNVVVHLGDGTRGWPACAPYEAILVTAGGPEVPPPLLGQLAPGGRLVGPFGERGAQELVRVIRDGSEGGFRRQKLGPCRFVDLVGAHGWAA